MALPDIYTSLDYQSWLRDCFVVLKAENRFFSYRFVGQRIDMDHSVVVKVLQGKRHLTSEQAKSFAGLLDLDKPQTAYFLALVDYGRAEKDADIRRAFENVLSLRPAAQRSLEASHYAYFQHWYHVAIRSLLDYYPFDGKNYAALAMQLTPPVSEAQVRESVELLLSLGLAAPNSQGLIKPTEAHLSTGDRWISAAVQAYQKEVIRLSEGALERIPRTDRDISTLTLSLDRASLDEIREVLRECRQTIVKIVDRVAAAKTDAVYQLNMQFVPLTVPAQVRSTVKTRKGGA
jgi:uncharacterized protein (TIGR02147 family)